MTWPKDTDRLLVRAFRALGLRGWELQFGEYEAIITADPSKRRATIAMGTCPDTREEAIETMIHEATHALVAKHTRPDGTVNYAGLEADLLKRLGKRRAKLVAADVEEALCDAVGKVLAGKLMRKEDTK